MIIVVLVEVVLIFVLLTQLFQIIIDARKCISYLTIEHKGPVPISIRKKLEIKFTVVMIVISICPWNKFAKPTKNKNLILMKIIKV